MCKIFFSLTNQQKYLFYKICVAENILLHYHDVQFSSLFLPSFTFKFTMECLLGDMILSVTGSSIENVDDLRDLQYKLSYYTILSSLYICICSYTLQYLCIYNYISSQSFL